MTLTIKSKQVEKLVAKTTEITDNPYVEIVEEMSLLQIQLDTFKLISAKYDTLKKTLLDSIPLDATEFEPYTFTGTAHKVVFSARAKKREVTDMEAAKEALGVELFMKIAKIGLTELDKYLSQEEKDKFIIETQTGPRSCVVKETGQ